MVISELHDEINRHRSTAFSDASSQRGGRIENVEVLATVPDLLPDYSLFNHGRDFKYDDYRKLGKDKYKRRQYDKWSALISQASVFIYDPVNVIESLKASAGFKEYLSRHGDRGAEQWLSANLCLHSTYLMPEVWQNALPVMEGQMLWADPDPSRVH